MTQEMELKVTRQQLMLTYRTEQEKLAALQRRLDNLQRLFQNIAITTEAVKEVAGAKKNEKAMVSLGVGVFAEATLQNNTKFKVMNAGDAMLTEDSKKVLQILEKKAESTQKDVAIVQREAQQVLQNLNSLASVIEGSRSQGEK